MRGQVGVWPGCLGICERVRVVTLLFYNLFNYVTEQAT